MGDHLRVRGVGEEVGDGHRFVTCWTKPARANTTAETPTVGAVLVAEIAGLAGWALIDGAWPRRTRWDDRQRDWVTAPPRLLATRVITEAPPTDAPEPIAADGADR